jgi:PEP-CTERM motif
MKNHLLTACLAAVLWAALSTPVLAQSADLHTWTAAGDVVVDNAGTARLTTAYLDEAPVSAGAALLFDELETALSLPAGSLAADTIEGSGLAHSFAAAAGTTVQFDWRLSTVDFDPAQADRAFVLIHGGNHGTGGALVSLGTVAASTVSGHFSHTFTSAGLHALAIVVMDVSAADRVSTLALSNLSISAVPEPGSWALLLAGLGVVGVASLRRLGRAAARRR